MRRASLLLFALVACVSGETGLGGELAVTSREHGSWSVAPDDCFSGERQGFFGVDLLEGDDQGRIVRIVLDPIDGYVLKMNAPERDYALVVGPDDGCARWDFLVERTNTRVNNVWEVRGHANVTCDLPDLEIHADLSFSACW